MDGFTNRSGLGLIPTVRAQGLEGAANGRGTNPGRRASAYVAEAVSNKIKVNQITPVNIHMGEGVTCATETSWAREAAIWLGAGTTPSPDPIVAQQPEATVNIGPGTLTNEGDDPTHKAF